MTSTTRIATTSESTKKYSSDSILGEAAVMLERTSIAHTGTNGEGAERHASKKEDYHRRNHKQEQDGLAKPGTRQINSSAHGTRRVRKAKSPARASRSQSPVRDRHSQTQSRSRRSQSKSPSRPPRTRPSATSPRPRTSTGGRHSPRRTASASGSPQKRDNLKRPSQGHTRRDRASRSNKAEEGKVDSQQGTTDIDMSESEQRRRSKAHARRPRGERSPRRNHSKDRAEELHKDDTEHSQDKHKTERRERGHRRRIREDCHSRRNKQSNNLGEEKKDMSESQEDSRSQEEDDWATDHSQEKNEPMVISTPEIQPPPSLTLWEGESKLGTDLDEDNQDMDLPLIQSDNNVSSASKSTTSTTGMGLFKSVVSTTANMGLNVASTTANVASTTANMGINVGMNVASTVVAAPTMTLKASLTTFSTAATSVISQGRAAIHRNSANAHQFMKEGVAPGQNLAKFLEDVQSGTIPMVTKSWKKLKKIDDYEQKAGILLFTHLFENCPAAKGVFGFPADIDPRSPQVQNSAAFKRQSSHLILMLDKAMGLLSDMIESEASKLQAILFDLGKRHSRMGVEQEYFPYMGAALVNALNELLGRKVFTASVEKSWVLVYNVLAGEMVHGMSSDNLALESWAKLKQIPYYKEKTGILLFQHLFQECPETVALFGLPHGFRPDRESLRNSRKFKMHAEYFILMLDKALHLVEENKLNQSMEELGEKHVQLGVKVEYFPVMGEGLFHALEVMLKNEFDEKTRDAWLSTYSRMSSKIISAIRASQ